ncbi:hypothetical protein QQ045_018307 [Rhodiola kirilowii]
MAGISCFLQLHSASFHHSVLLGHHRSYGHHSIKISSNKRSGFAAASLRQEESDDERVFTSKRALVFVGVVAVLPLLQLSGRAVESFPAAGGHWISIIGIISSGVLGALYASARQEQAASEAKIESTLNDKEAAFKSVQKNYEAKKLEEEFATAKGEILRLRSQVNSLKTSSTDKAPSGTELSENGDARADSATVSTDSRDFKVLDRQQVKGRDSEARENSVEMAERDFGAGDEEAEDLIGCGLHEGCEIKSPWIFQPNGRFETQTKICLSISNYHPEHWQPSWSVRTALVALIAFMPTNPNDALGSLDYTKEERKALAIKSRVGYQERKALAIKSHVFVLLVIFKLYQGHVG